VSDPFLSPKGGTLREKTPKLSERQCLHRIDFQACHRGGKSYVSLK
jgi:hypothetical protein